MSPGWSLVVASFALALPRTPADAAARVPGTIHAPAFALVDDRAQAAPEKKSADFYDEKADAKEQIAAATARAKKENRRVLLQWGGNWCIWCRRLHDLYSRDQAVAKKLLYEYDVVYVDSSKDGKNVELAASYGADLKKHGVPFLTILDADGKVLANQETGALETKVDGQDGHDAKKLLELLTKNQAPYRSADELLRAGLARAKEGGKRVFLHFGAPWCHWCHKLEGWMAAPAVAAILAKDFVDVKIDVDRTIGGSDVLKRYRSEDGGIPWIAFLDADGKTLASSGEGKANIGFPATPPEIDKFAAMLDAAHQRITTEDIDALKRSLAPPPPASPSK
jgi:thiol:disulfide interchange protein